MVRRPSKIGEPGVRELSCLRVAVTSPVFCSVLPSPRVSGPPHVAHEARQ